MLGGLCKLSIVCDVDLALCRTCCVHVFVVCVFVGFGLCCLCVGLCMLCIECTVFLNMLVFEEERQWYNKIIDLKMMLT